MVHRLSFCCACCRIKLTTLRKGVLAEPPTPVFQSTQVNQCRTSQGIWGAGEALGHTCVHIRKHISPSLAIPEVSNALHMSLTNCTNNKVPLPGLGAGLLGSSSMRQGAAQHRVPLCQQNVLHTAALGKWCHCRPPAHHFLIVQSALQMTNTASTTKQVPSGGFSSPYAHTNI